MHGLMREGRREPVLYSTQSSGTPIGVLAEIGMGGELERLIREGVIAVDGVKAGC